MIGYKYWFLIFCYCPIAVLAQLNLDQYGYPSEEQVKTHQANHTVAPSGLKQLKVVSAIPSPVQSTYLGDIAFDGTHLWVQGFDEFKLHQISMLNGSIIRSIPTAVLRPNGLTFDGEFLWLADGNYRTIQKIDPANGNVVDAFSVPVSRTFSYPNGMAFGDHSLWLNDPKSLSQQVPNDSTYNIDTSGALINGFHAIGEFPTGLAYDGQHLWTADNSYRMIHQVDPKDFTILNSFEAPGGYYPNGLAFDGYFLWVANNHSDSIYRIDFGFTPNVVIEPFRFDSVCVDYNRINLPPARPLGGHYSGNGVDGDTIFHPNTAGVGTHYIYYHFTDGVGRQFVDSAKIIVFDCHGDLTVPVDEEQALETALVYPNPGAGVFHLSLDHPLPRFRYSVTTFDGKTIRNERAINTDQVVIDLSAESRGIYLLQLTDGIHRRTIELIRE